MSPVPLIDVVGQFTSRPCRRLGVILPQIREQWVPPCPQVLLMLVLIMVQVLLMLVLSLAMLFAAGWPLAPGTLGRW